MLKNDIFCEMIILVVFKGFLLVKNLEILVQIVLDRSTYYYSKLLFTVQRLCIEEKMFWFIEAINETSAANSIMNLSHTLYFIPDVKALCSILYSSGNIQMKSCWCPVDPPSPPPPSQLH